MDAMFPIKIKISSKLAQELAYCEEGRHEDYETHKEEYPDYPILDYPHAYHIADKAATDRGNLVIENNEQASDLYYAVCSGTFQLYHLATSTRIADILREVVRAHEPSLVNRWPAPSGH